jgi:prolipoprotein diacylglyceryltransferase
VLVWIGRRWDPKPGQIFTGYVAGYAAGRFWVEALRIDPASEVLGFRVNLWVSGLTFAVAVLAIRARSEPRGAPVPAPAADGLAR